MRKALIGQGLAFTLVVFAMNLAQATFLPENEIHYDAVTKGVSNMTEAEFKSIISEAHSIYAPIAQKHGGKLSIQGNWSSEKLNAGAAQMFGNWQVQISGGLARLPELTPDGFTLILCHELGHHLGGFSFAPPRMPIEGVWAATEGQSDYFATQVCAREMWGAEVDKNATFRGKVSEFVKNSCDSVWSTAQAQNLCYRVAAGTESLILTMATLKKEPMVSFETPDTNVVNETKSAHPATQCRMDTSFQGALCTAAFNPNIIPGKKTSGGPNGLEAEKEAAQVSCTKQSNYEIGLRPLCWHKPRL